MVQPKDREINNMLLKGKKKEKENLPKSYPKTGNETLWAPGDSSCLYSGQLCAQFYFLGSQITAGDDCNYEIKRRLLLGRKAMTNQDSILKSRNITLPMKVRLVKSCFFSSHVWM